MPNRSDLYVSRPHNRQAARSARSRRSDAVIVIGSANSSNTVALTKVAEAVAVRGWLRVNGAFELPDDCAAPWRSRRSVGPSHWSMKCSTH